MNGFEKFFIDGFLIFENANLLAVSDFTFVNVEKDERSLLPSTKAQDDLIIAYISRIQDGYLSKMFPATWCVGYSLWDGVDSGSMCWHNDHDEGFDLNVLYYFDTQTPNTGGQIEFKNQTTEHTFYPLANSIVFINQSKQFFHRAYRSTSARRIVSAEFKVIK